MAPCHSTKVLAILFFALHLTLVVSTNTKLRGNKYGEKDDHLIARRLNSSPTDDDKTVPFNSWDNTIDTVRYGLSFVIVLVAAHPLGLFFPKFFKLPLITGYLVIGIIAGPFVANLMTDGLVNMMSNDVSALALSFISFQAGQEIYLPELRPQLKSIMILLATLYVTAMIILSSAILLVEDAFFYDGMGIYCQLGIALMFGSISVLGSPATVMAIKIELNSVGPFTSLMLGATMTAEFVVLLSFSISRIVCSIYCAKLHVSMVNLAYTMGIVLANIVVGVVLAGFTYLIFKIPGGRPHQSHHTRASRRMESVDHVMTPHHAYDDEANTVKSSSCWSSNAALSLKAFIWLSMGYMFYISTATLAQLTAAAYGPSWEIKFEPLLMLMIASCIAGHYSAIRHDMHVILDAAAPYMFLPFFVMTGAALKLDQVVAAIPLMSIYVLLRYVAIFIACYFGGRFLLKLTPRQYNNLWLTMTPQTGVALGLANEVKAMSDEPWAAEFAATIVAAVVVNQIVGPVLCSMGLSQAGETLQDRAVDENDHKNERNSKYHDVEAESIELGVHQGRTSTRSRFSVYTNEEMPSPFCKVKDAVVIGDDETAVEIALNLSLYGAHVNVPLLDKERAGKWKEMNKTILSRAVKGDLISFRNTLKDRDNTQTMSSADVILFTGDANRTSENVRILKSLLGASHPRMIAFVPDCKFSKELKAEGVLVIQPPIALANLATRMALLDRTLAEALSNEISSTSDFSTASYFLGAGGGGRGSLSEMRLEGRHLALGRSVVNHHSVDYDRLAEVLTAENLPMPPPPSRVSMFGTSAAGFDPFSVRGEPKSVFQHFIVEDEVVHAGTRTPNHGQRGSIPSVHFRIISTP